MAIVQIKRKIYGKNTFTNVVDPSFTELVPQDGAVDATPEADVTSFFNDYDTLFFDIAPSGSDQSHLELVRRSGEYIGINIYDLREEIANLREENVSLKNQLITKINTGI